MPVDEEIYLKQVELSCAGDLFGLIDECRPYLRQWLSWVDNTETVEDTMEYIRSAEEGNMFRGRLVFAIYYRGIVAGLIDLHNGDRENLKGEIGYWLAEKFQNKGIITRSCRAVVDYVFKMMGLNRIVIRCAAGNTKSQKVPERLGFSYEGIEKEGQQLYDEFHDLKIYSMLRKDWQVNI